MCVDIPSLPGTPTPPLPHTFTLQGARWARLKMAYFPGPGTPTHLLLCLSPSPRCAVGLRLHRTVSLSSDRPYQYALGLFRPYNTPRPHPHTLCQYALGLFRPYKTPRPYPHTLCQYALGLLRRLQDDRSTTPVVLVTHRTTELFHPSMAEVERMLPHGASPATFSVLLRPSLSSPTLTLCVCGRRQLCPCSCVRCHLRTLLHCMCVCVWSSLQAARR